MPSTSDLAFLYPSDSYDVAIEKILSTDAQIIALKRGHEGATIFNKNETNEIERFDFAPHNVAEIDPTGAGDCFCATFMSLIAQGESAYKAGYLANAAGAIAVTRRGPMEGNSKRKEIEEFLENRNAIEQTA